MNNLLGTTVGIDTTIQGIQTDLYDILKSKWVDSIDAFGRVYKNRNVANELKPQRFVGDGDYEDVFYNDEFACTYAFIDDDNHLTEDGFVYTSVVKCVFMVDLSKILPTENDRADAKAQRDVVHVLREISFGKFDIVGIEKGITNVWSGFDVTGIKFNDIHPLHCFSVNIKLSYYLNQECE